jgi:hypothetical protein
VTGRGSVAPSDVRKPAAPWTCSTAEVTELLRECGCISTTAGPDGREFQFADGERLEVGGTCNACDENEIRKFLESR